MYTVVKSIHKPTIVENCVFEHFTSKINKNLIISGSNILTIYNIIDSKSEYFLNKIDSYEFLDNIVCFTSIYLCDIDRYGLIIGFKYAKFSILVFDSNVYNLKTISLHNFETPDFKSGFYSNIYLPQVARDPIEKCVAMSFYNHFFAILPLSKTYGLTGLDEDDDNADDLSNVFGESATSLQTQSTNLVQDDKNKLPSSQSSSFRLPPSMIINLKQIVAKCARITDFAFLNGYYEPTLLILYEPSLTWCGKISAKQETSCIIALSINLYQRVSPVIWSMTNLPYDAIRILPVPRPIGGAIVLAVNSIVYINQSKASPISSVSLNKLAPKDYVTPTSLDLALVLKRDTCHGAFFDWKSALISTDGHYGSTNVREGKYCVIRFVKSDGTEIDDPSTFSNSAALRLMVELTSPFTHNGEPYFVDATCMCYCGVNLLFIGSHVSDSLLIRLEQKDIKSEIPEESTNESLDTVSTTNRLYSICIQDYILNIGPCSGVTLGQPLINSEDFNSQSAENEGETHDPQKLIADPDLEMLVNSGKDGSGGLTLLQKSIIPQLITTFQLPNVTNMWSLFGPHHKRNYQHHNNDETSLAEYHSYLLLTVQNSSLVLLTGQEITELEQSGFNVQSPTLSASNLYLKLNNESHNEQCYIVQITPVDARLLLGDKMIQCFTFDLHGMSVPIVSASICDPYILLLGENGAIDLLLVSLQSSDMDGENFGNAYLQHITSYVRNIKLKPPIVNAYLHCDHASLFNTHNPIHFKTESLVLANQHIHGMTFDFSHLSITSSGRTKTDDLFSKNIHTEMGNNQFSPNLTNNIAPDCVDELAINDSNYSQGIDIDLRKLDSFSKGEHTSLTINPQAVDTDLRNSTMIPISEKKPTNAGVEKFEMATTLPVEEMDEDELLYGTKLESLPDTTMNKQTAPTLFNADGDSTKQLMDDLKSDILGFPLLTPDKMDEIETKPPPESSKIDASEFDKDFCISLSKTSKTIGQQTYWAFITRVNGSLEIYSLPKFTQVFTVPYFNLKLEVLTDTNDMNINNTQSELQSNTAHYTDIAGRKKRKKAGDPSKLPIYHNNTTSLRQHNTLDMDDDLRQTLQDTYHIRDLCLWTVSYTNNSCVHDTNQHSKPSNLNRQKNDKTNKEFNHNPTDEINDTIINGGTQDSINNITDDFLFSTEIIKVENNGNEKFPNHGDDEGIKTQSCDSDPLVLTKTYLLALINESVIVYEAYACPNPNNSHNYQHHTISSENIIPPNNDGHIEKKKAVHDEDNRFLFSSIPNDDDLYSTNLNTSEQSQIYQVENLNKDAPNTHPQAHGRLNVKFRKIDLNLLMGERKAAKTLPKKEAFYRLLNVIRTTPMFRPYHNINNSEGAMIQGLSPYFIMPGKDGELKAHPYTLDGPLYAFTPFHNINCPRGFIYFNWKDELRVCAFPTHVKYDTEWLHRKINLGVRVHFIEYNVKLKLYVLVSSRSFRAQRVVKGINSLNPTTAFGALITGTALKPNEMGLENVSDLNNRKEEKNSTMIPSENGVETSTPSTTAMNQGLATNQTDEDDELFDEKEMEDVENDPKYPPPIQHEFAIDLLSPVTWEVIPSAKLALTIEWERVSAFKQVSLTSLGTHSGFKDYLAMGTASVYGEDVSCRGRLFIMDIIEVVPLPGQPMTRYKIKVLCGSEHKGPIFAISCVSGNLVTVIGQKIYIWTLTTNNELTGLAFIDTSFCVHSLAIVKNLILVGDLHKSVALLRYDPSTKTISVASKDFSHMSVYGIQFIVDNEKLAFLASDRESNFTVFTYNPSLRESYGGQRLVRKGDINIGTHVLATFFRIFCRRKDSTSDKKPSLALERRQATYYVGVDGRIGFVLPINEKIFRRLSMLQSVMDNSILHLGGLNAKSSRTYKMTRMELINPARNMLDGNFLVHFLQHNVLHQELMAKQIGVSLDQIIDDFMEIDRTTNHF